MLYSNVLRTILNDIMESYTGAYNMCVKLDKLFLRELFESKYSFLFDTPGTTYRYNYSSSIVNVFKLVLSVVFVTGAKQSVGILNK